MTDPDYTADLKAAIANLRRSAPERGADPERWGQPDSPYALMTRQLLENALVEIRDLRTEVRRWALGMTAAVVVAFIVGMLQL